MALVIAKKDLVNIKREAMSNIESSTIRNTVLFLSSLSDASNSYIFLADNFMNSIVLNS